MHNEYAAFAARFAIPPAQAYVLPALFESAAWKVGMGVATLVADATYRNRELGEYIAAAAKRVAEQDAQSIDLSKITF
jgi:hypothetical protein